jgi:hypothetical protein
MPIDAEYPSFIGRDIRQRASLVFGVELLATSNPMIVEQRIGRVQRLALRLHGSHGQFDRRIEPALSGAGGADEAI